MELVRYVLVDLNDNESDEYDRYDQAEDACDSEHAIVQRTYEYTDSELVYTPDGGNVWPPEHTESD